MEEGPTTPARQLLASVSTVVLYVVIFFFLFSTNSDFAVMLFILMAFILLAAVGTRQVQQRRVDYLQAIEQQYGNAASSYAGPIVVFTQNGFSAPLPVAQPADDASSGMRVTGMALRTEGHVHNHNDAGHEKAADEEEHGDGDHVYGRGAYFSAAPGELSGEAEVMEGAADGEAKAHDSSASLSREGGGSSLSHPLIPRRRSLSLLPRRIPQ